MNSAAKIIDVPIKDLAPSRRNVRKSKPTSAEDAELLAGIRANGVLQNLVVIPGKKSGKFDVIAGKRRLKAAQDLTKQGHYSEDQTIHCILVDADVVDIEEIGTIENVQRVKMHPADEFEAFSKMRKNGQSPQDIALHMGISEATVYKRLTLADVNPKIVKAYRNNELGLEAVMAFTIEDDKSTQLDTFTLLRDQDRLHAHLIRRDLKDDGVETSNGRLGKFVGIKAYTKADGSVSQDLFQEVTYFNDRDILTTLAIEKLERESKKLSDNWNWIEVTLDTPSLNMKTITAHDTSETQALIDKQTAIENKLDVLSDMDTDDWEPKHSEQETRLEAQLNRAENAVEASKGYNADQQALSGCILSIGADGTTLIEYGLVRKKDEKTLEKLLNPNGKKASDTSPGSNQESSNTKTNNSSEDDSKPSQALLGDLATYRTNIAKRSIATSIPVALDALYYTVTYSALVDFWYDNPIAISVTETRLAKTLSKPDEGRAVEEMQHIRDDLPLDWFGIESEVERFTAFCALEDIDKERLVSFGVALSFKGELSHGNAPSESLIETIISRLDIPWHSYFNPTSDNYLNRIGKPNLIKLGAEFLGDEWAEAAQKQAKREVAVELEDIFAGNNTHLTITQEKRSEAIDWIPPGFKVETEQ